MNNDGFVSQRMEDIVLSKLDTLPAASMNWQLPAVVILLPLLGNMFNQKKEAHTYLFLNIYGNDFNCRLIWEGLVVAPKKRCVLINVRNFLICPHPENKLSMLATLTSLQMCSSLFVEYTKTKLVFCR